MVAVERVDAERQIAANKAEMVAGIRKIHEWVMAERGLDAKKYSKQPGFGRLLTDEEMKKLTRAKEGMDYE